MRLTCPDCGARYEIADNLIPAGGRDVQCSNCEATWFQTGDARPAANVEPFPNRVPSSDVPADASQSGTQAGTPDLSDRPLEERHPPEVIETLREERAHEDRVRATNRGGAGAVDEGSLAELFAPRGGPGDGAAVPHDDGFAEGHGVDDEGGEDDGDPEAAGRRERARMAAAAARARQRDRAGGVQAAEPMTPAAPDRTRDAPGSAPSRAATLPDIAPDAERLDRRAAGRRPPPIYGTEPERETTRGGGGRTLLVTLLLVLAAAAAVYLFAPQIVAQVPDLAEPLDDYAGFVNAGLAEAERGIEAATAWLESLTAE